MYLANLQQLPPKAKLIPIPGNLRIPNRESKSSIPNNFVSFKKERDTVMRNGKHIVLAAVLFLAFSALAKADESGKEHHGQGYLFVAGGVAVQRGYYRELVHFGGGGEGLVYKGIGVGSEIGLLTTGPESSMGLLSVNGSYHFLRNRKLSPFVTSGYSVAFRDGHANLVNFGGGVHWWFREGAGVRLEFRDHIHSYRGVQTSFLEARIGFSFR